MLSKVISPSFRPKRARTQAQQVKKKDSVGEREQTQKKDSVGEKERES